MKSWFIPSQLHRLQDFLNLIPLPAYVKDQKGRYRACNVAFEAFTAVPSKQIVGKSVFDFFPHDEAALLFADDRELLESPGLHIYELTLTGGRDESRTIRFYKAPLKNEADTAEGLLGVIVDMTEKATQVRKLQEIASHDDLTGITNRREGDAQLEKMFDHAVRSNGVLSIAMMDVDSFKTINDAHGHQYGDTILREVAQITRGCLRNYDLVFRYGGDEFLIALPDAKGKQARAIASRIRKAIEGHFKKSSGREMTVSVGISSFPKDAQVLRLLIGEADGALYQAKKNGRNRIEMWKKIPPPAESLEPV